MPNNFTDKDYSGYFSQVERSLLKETSKQNKVQKPSKKSAPTKKIVGAVISVRKLRPWVKVGAVLLTAVLLIVAFSSAFSSKGDKKDLLIPESQEAEKPVETVKVTKNLVAKSDAHTQTIGDEFVAQNIVFIDTEENRIVAQKNSDQRVSPASTTKIMTLLVAVEKIKNFDDTFTMTFEITDPLYRENATVAGFLSGEEINMTDLLYGTILPSGADATIALAIKLCGSEENFVKEMNEKVKELGLKNTNFKNSSGLFQEGHYTTAEDLAVILRAAMENELCRKILSTYQYTAKPTTQHPEGLEMTSTLFGSMYGDEPEGAVILGGKTGFINESGYCIASFGENEENKKEYVCVTLGTQGRWPAVYAQIDLYSRFAK